MSATIEDYILRRKANRESESKKDYFAFRNGRRMIMMHICLGCGRQMPYSSRRRACPFCSGILRVKTKIIKE